MKTVAVRIDFASRFSYHRLTFSFSSILKYLGFIVIADGMRIVIF